MKKVFLLFMFFGVFIQLYAKPYITGFTDKKNDSDLVFMATYDGVEIYSLIEGDSISLWYLENGTLLYSAFSSDCDYRNISTSDGELLVSIQKQQDDYYTMEITANTDCEVVMQRIQRNELPYFDKP